MSFAVFHLEAVEDHLRGYVRRYLFEVVTNLYLGNVSRTVADGLWDRVVMSTSGRALLVLPDGSERGFSVRLHNVADVELVDFDGLVMLARRHSPSSRSVLPA